MDFHNVDKFVMECGYAYNKLQKNGLSIMKSQEYLPEYRKAGNMSLYRGISNFRNSAKILFIFKEKTS